MIVDRQVVKTNVDGSWSKPETVVGPGAFKMSARAPNQSLDYVAMPSWWGRPKPTLSKVHIEVVTDPEAAMAKYRQGSFDIFGYGGYPPPATDVAGIQAKPAEKAQVLLEVTNKTYFVSFNMVADATRPVGGPFTLDQGKASHDRRLAFALSVDRAKLAKDVCSDVTCVPATGGVIPKGLLGYRGDSSDPLAAFDPLRAMTLPLACEPSGAHSKGLTYISDPEQASDEPVANDGA